MSETMLHRSFAGVALLLIGGALVWGFILVGSPGGERLRRLDAQRIRDLAGIHGAIEQLCVQRDKERARLIAPLPATLSELADKVRAKSFYAVQIHDPQTGAEYGYTVKGKTEYELCATFDRPRSEQAQVFWNHPGGRHCFAFNALAPVEPAPPGD